MEKMGVGLLLVLTVAVSVVLKCCFPSVKVN